VWLCLTPLWCALVVIVGLKWLQPSWCSENNVWYAAFFLAFLGTVLGILLHDRWGAIASLVTLALLLAVGLLLPMLRMAK